MAGMADGLRSDDLRILVAVARTGRMVAASALLGIDHTTVHRGIQRLERALGTSLIVRGTDGWELTPIGRDVVEQAAGLDDIVNKVRDVAGGEPSTARGRVRMTVPSGFGVSFVTPVLSRLIRQHPGLSLEVVTETRAFSERSTVNDIMIAFGRPSPGAKHAKLLTPFTLGLYASRSYLAESPPIGAIADLGAHRLVYGVESMLLGPDLSLGDGVLSGVEVGMGSTGILERVAATRYGAGVGLLPSFLAEREPDLVRILSRDVAFRRDISLNVRPASASVLAVQLICAELRAEVEGRRRELMPDQEPADPAGPE